MSLDEVRQENRVRHTKARAATQPTIASLGNRVGDRYTLNFTDGGIGYGEKLFNGVVNEGDRLLGITNSLGRVSVMGQNATNASPEILASPLSGASQIDRGDYGSGSEAPALRNRQGYLRGQIFADPEGRSIVWEYGAIGGTWSQQNVSRPFVGDNPDAFPIFGAVALGVLDLPNPATLRISLSGLMTADRGLASTADSFDIRFLPNQLFLGRKINRIMDFYPVVTEDYSDPYRVANVATTLTLELGNRLNDLSVGRKVYAVAAIFDPVMQSFFLPGYLDNVPATDASPIVSESGYTLQRLSFNAQVNIPSGKHAIVISAFNADVRFQYSAFYNTQVRLSQ